MSTAMPPPPPPAPGSLRRSHWFWPLAGGCLLAPLLGLLLPRENLRREATSADTSTTPAVGAQDLGARPRSLLTSAVARVAPASSPETVVARKLAQFVQHHRSITQAMAKKYQVQLPPEVDRFFDSAAAGDWETARHLFETLRMKRQDPTGAEGLNDVWGSIHATLCVAEVVHDWPAQKLLDYGESVLGSLRPGMVYFGGTDPGRGIPTLLNETSEGEHHIVLTQNALADNSYLQYVSFLYGDQMTTLTPEDSQQVFADYMSDVKKRFDHDQQFPDQPRQLRPGEEVEVNDGRVQVSGQVAVMGINERLVQALVQKNPELTFAMEESYPLQSFLLNATPLGPIMELGTHDTPIPLTTDAAAQAVAYWQETAQELLADTEVAPDSDPRKAYSKMASAAGGLLAERNFPAEAEEAFRIANELCPSSPEAVFRYVDLLVGQQRFSDAAQVVQNAVAVVPENEQFKNLLESVRRLAAR